LTKKTLLTEAPPKTIPQTTTSHWRSWIGRNRVSGPDTTPVVIYDVMLTGDLT